MMVITVGRAESGEEKFEAGGRYGTVLKMGGMEDDTLLEYMSMRWERRRPAAAQNFCAAAD